VKTLSNCGLSPHYKYTKSHNFPPVFPQKKEDSLLFFLLVKTLSVLKILGKFTIFYAILSLIMDITA
jgi:hypothetical protein